MDLKLCRRFWDFAYDFSIEDETPRRPAVGAAHSLTDNELRIAVDALDAIQFGPDSGVGLISLWRTRSFVFSSYSFGARSDDVTIVT